MRHERYYQAWIKLLKKIDNSFIQLTLSSFLWALFYLILYCILFGICYFVLYVGALFIIFCVIYLIEIIIIYSIKFYYCCCNCCHNCFKKKELPNDDKLKKILTDNCIICLEPFKKVKMKK